MELLASILGSCTFTWFLSSNKGRQITEHNMGRAILGGMGMFIAIAGYAANQRSFAMFIDMSGWFILVYLPVLAWSIWDAIDKDADKDKQHKQELVKKDLDHYSVKRAGMTDEEIIDEFACDHDPI